MPLVTAPDNLPDPDVLAEEIAENLESALGIFLGDYCVVEDKTIKRIVILWIVYIPFSKLKNEKSFPNNLNSGDTIYYLWLLGRLHRIWQ